MAHYCENCGNHVSEQFARVLFEEDVTVCPNCPDKPVSEVYHPNEGPL